MWAAARFLADEAHVSVLTSSRWKARYEELTSAGDERLPEGVRFAFVDEPEGDLSPFLSWNHAWSVKLLEGVAELHPDGGPDILELGDYQAEGFAAAHARRGHDPRLRDTTLVVRLHTSGEMCAVMNEDPGGVHLDLIAGLERFSLRFADAVLEPGGNCLEHYREFYGEGALAPTLESPLPITADVRPPADGTPARRRPAPAPVPEPAGGAQGDRRARVGRALAARRGARADRRGWRHPERAGRNLHARARRGAGRERRADPVRGAGAARGGGPADRRAPRGRRAHALGDVLLRGPRGARVQPARDRHAVRGDRGRGPPGRDRLADRRRDGGGARGRAARGRGGPGRRDGDDRGRPPAAGARPGLPGGPHARRLPRAAGAP